MGEVWIPRVYTTQTQHLAPTCVRLFSVPHPKATRTSIQCILLPATLLGLPSSSGIQPYLGWWPQEALRAKPTWFLILLICDMHTRNVVWGAVISYPKRLSLEQKSPQSN